MSLSVAQIDMDHYGVTKDRLATKEVASCICFIVILNDGKDVFLEHRSDIYLPSTVELENVSLCFQNLAEHIEEASPSSQIASFFILGGYNKQQRFVELKEKITQLIQVGFDHMDDDVSPYYEQLLNTVRCHDVCLNIELELEGSISESFADIIVDKSISNGEHLLIINQYIKTSTQSNRFIAVLAIDIKTNKRSFAINQTEIENLTHQTSSEYQCVKMTIEHFQSHAMALGAIQLEANLACELLNFARCLSGQIDSKFFDGQKELTAADQEMCQVVVYAVYQE